MRSIIIVFALCSSAIGQVVFSGNVSVSGTTVASSTGSPAPPVLSVNTSSVPACVQGSGYASTAPLSAQNGTAPYTWTPVPFSGTLPPGVTYNSSGVWSGTCTTVGNYSFVVQVQDNVGATARSVTLTIQVTSSGSSAYNPYCNSSNTWTGGASDGPAGLPTACINTAIANTPSPGSVITVAAGNASDLTTKLAALTCGQTLKIPAQCATVNGQCQYSGSFTIPANSCALNNWMTIESDQVGNSNFPPEGTRATPAYVGIASFPGYPSFASSPATPGVYMPQLIASNNTLICPPGLQGARIIGLDITTTAGSSPNAVVKCAGNGAAGLAHYVIFDRYLVHGGNSPTGASHDNVTRGIDASNMDHFAAVDGSCYDVHMAGQDAQCFLWGGLGANQELAYSAKNNFISSAAGGIAAGGGGVGATTTTPTDAEILKNHFFKPLFWKKNDPSYFGTQFQTKNNFELKTWNRLLFEGNILENCWDGQSDQFGACIIWGPKNQSVKSFGTASSDGAGNLVALSGTFRSDSTSANCATPNQCRLTYSGVNYNVCTFTNSTHVTLCTAAPASSSAAFTACGVGQNPNGTLTNWTFRYFTIHGAARGMENSSAVSDCGDISGPMAFGSIHDAVLDNIDPVFYHVEANPCCSWGMLWGIQNLTSVVGAMHDITLRHTTGLSFLGGAGGTGLGPSFGFSAKLNSSDSLANIVVEDNISPTGWGASANGPCVAGSSAATYWNCWSVPPTYTWDYNCLATASVGSNTAVANNSPYPGTHNQIVANYAAFNFTNLNGANNTNIANYLLQNTSPCHNAASDGTDMGANINSVVSATAGVY